MLSYWEQQWLLNYNYIVVGSGIVGLSTAISIKQHQPGSRVLVLEKGILPTGASTKNAGFACIGSLTEVLDDLKTMPAEEVVALVQLRLQGLTLLRQRLGDAVIDYRENGSYELITPAEEDCLQHINEVNSLLSLVVKGNAFTPCSEKIKLFGFASNKVSHLISNNYEGELNTGKMMRALIDKCISYGIEIKTGCTVAAVNDNGDGAEVVLKMSDIEPSLAFKADCVAVCNNAFAKGLLPAVDVKPGRGQVLLTEPIGGLPFKGIFHFDKGYYYFRSLDGRVLFGGGRNIDFEGEETTEFGFNEAIRNDLLEKLHTLILPDKAVQVNRWWSGIMAFGGSKQPIIQQISRSVFAGVRMGGMGVAIGTAVGEKLARLMLSR